ncbi:fanconi anemia group D2 protein homolog [Striga asiatica]|uniref:Fanconi anemia group D2 protein homolog n=1 Tax=Striga asiatica TaxID=4170 RepID=A0A5A7PJ65_STRAF|nr:fanconi anemia group D2 protein homolog [Striga asiatica]
MLPRKRPSKPKLNSPFVPPFAKPLPAKRLKPTASTANVPAPAERRTTPSPQSQGPIDKMVVVLAEAGCTLLNPAGPPCLPSDLYGFRQRLDSLFSDDTSLRSQFLKGFSEHISSVANLRRVLLPTQQDGFGSVTSESLIRVLLLVKCIQQDLLDMLLEKLPEYFDGDSNANGSGLTHSSCLYDDVARLILNQFRWLDFLVCSEGFVEKLLQVLSICPHHLKKEIIEALPEIIGDQNNETVVSSLQQMLQEDSSIIVPVLDSFSNLKLDDLLQDQVITIALSCIRTIDIEHMPYLLRYLLLSAKALNARRIFSHIREQLKFLGASHARTSQRSKLKGKAVVDNTEASILDSLRSSLRFKNILCMELLKELKSLEEACDHKVIDIWLLTLIFMNSESLHRSVEKLFKKKIVEGCFDDHMFDQCIHGIKDLPKDFLRTFLSLSAYLLGCKEQRAQEFGIHIYICLFEEFDDAYTRQEVLGALLTHVGSGICYEVSAALDAMVKLASKKSQELISLSSYITGILDYLEGFSVASLHKVYELFICLAVSAQSCTQPYGCSIANELLMILRKQINNSDLIYKKMGLIGTVKLVASIGDINNTSLPHLSLRSNHEEAVELLKLSLDSCKQLPLPSAFFYEELILTLQSKTLHPTIMEWVGKQVIEFESTYLSDLDRGNLAVSDLSYSLEGEVWMNLDGDISPICLNILPLVFPLCRPTSPLQVLPTKFVLLSVVERLANQGSLGGIDALLGCPFHLPSSKLFSELSWLSLTAKQKQIAILSLYYADNWMRELLNVFSRQVVEECNSISQATKEDIIIKLLKRLRNLVYVECILDNFLKKHPILLPELYPHFELSPTIEFDNAKEPESMSETLKESKSSSQSKRRSKGKSSLPSSNSNDEDKSRQPTIVDLWKKAGATPSQEATKEDVSITSSKATQSESEGNQADKYSTSEDIEISAYLKCLEVQKYKFRPLSFDCLSLLAHLEKDQDSCCADPSAKLPLHLYLMRDLHQKLLCSSPSRKQNSAKGSNASAGLLGLQTNDFIRKIPPLFPYLRKNFDSARHILREGSETCQEHWKEQCRLAANPEIINTSISASPALTSISVFKETLLCFGKILHLAVSLKEKTILSGLLQAFQPMDTPDCFFQGLEPVPSPGNTDYLYCGAYSFLGAVFDVEIEFSFTLAFEVLLTLEVMITSIRMILGGSICQNGKDACTGFNNEIVPFLCNKLESYAEKLLKHNCVKDDVDGSSKAKGEMIHKILRIYLGNCQSTSDTLNKLARSILPKFRRQKEIVGKYYDCDLIVRCGSHIPSNAFGDEFYPKPIYHGIRAAEFVCLEAMLGLDPTHLVSSSSSVTALEGDNDDNETFPTLCSATIMVWYRVMLEENISTLINLAKEIASQEKPRGGLKPENVESFLERILQSVDVFVSLINVCRDNDKVSVHAMAVKYGGKFIDSFLKGMLYYDCLVSQFFCSPVFNFLKAQFQMHKDLILNLIRELQKATRTIQTLCSEAKGSKQTSITGKIPATKRSMERFLFHVKALLYETPSGCSFWMGNLKHKDLTGHLVSSQAYLDTNDDDTDDNHAETIIEDQENPPEAIVEDQPTNVSSP